MTNFLSQWQEAALTSTGFFWMVLWAFALGYLIPQLKISSLGMSV